MKILCLASSLGSGGAERVLTSLCNAWGARGDDVSLVATFSGGGQSFYAISDAVELVYLAEVVGTTDRNIFSYAKRFYALRRLIKRKAPDVIVSFLPNVNVAAIVASAFLKVPVIICERTDPSSRSRFDFWQLCSRATYRFADIFTVQTEAVASKVHGIYPRLGRVRIVPNPLSEEIASFSAKPGNERKILLSMGRLTDEKQVDKVILAFSDIASRFTDWDLHIYGDGPNHDFLNSRVGELGLHDRVFLKGNTKNPWLVMASVDAFVMTSKREGFPNVLLEAMAVGLPCVVFDCPSGPREISRGGKDALLVPLDDHDGLVSALIQLMSDEALRRSLGEQAKNSVCTRFSLREIVAKWDSLFREAGASH